MSEPKTVSQVSDAMSAAEAVDGSPKSPAEAYAEAHPDFEYLPIEEALLDGKAVGIAAEAAVAA